MEVEKLFEIKKELENSNVYTFENFITKIKSCFKLFNSH